jgi:hypothetical protein
MGRLVQGLVQRQLAFRQVLSSGARENELFHPLLPLTRRSLDPRRCHDVAA